jgi:hypothetical protein
MTKGLPWFKCYPAKLLATFSAVQPDDGYVFITVLCRIYEEGGPVEDSAATLARRTGLPERRVAASLKSLTATKRITIEDGFIDSESTHEILGERENVIGIAIINGKAGGKQKAENGALKRQQQQQNDVTNATPSLDDSLAETKRPPSYLDLDIEEDIDGDRKAGEKQEKAKADALVRATLFAEFWKIWPHKVGLKNAAKAFDLVAKQADYNHGALIDGTQDYIANKPHDRTWLNPATFLNDRRFEDRPYPTQKPPRTVQDAARDLHQLALDGGLQFPPLPPRFSRERNAERIRQLRQEETLMLGYEGDASQSPDGQPQRG